MTITGQFIEKLLAFNYESLPPEAIEASKQVTLDTLAVMLAGSTEPMGVGSIQHCVRLAVAQAGLPKATCVHTLRHSYATHLLEAGVSIRLISARTESCSRVTR